jgi:hypothetical protein
LWNNFGINIGSIKANILHSPANACLGRLEDNLRRISLGTLIVPEGTDIASFLLSDGRQVQKPVADKALSLKELFNQFFDNIPANSLESETIKGMRIHERHLLKRLGARFHIQDLTLTDLQDYVHKRARVRFMACSRAHCGAVGSTTGQMRLEHGKRAEWEEIRP